MSEATTAPVPAGGTDETVETREAGETGGPGWLLRAGWLALAGVVTAVVVAVVYFWDETAFLVDDKRDQYLPVTLDIGRRLTSGEWLPVIDPNLGIGGNYAIDIQYGLYDPSHWAVAIALSRFSDLDLAGFLWVMLFEVVLAVGTSALACRLRMTGAWAAAAGVAVATSGWIFFKLGPDWMPGLVSIAWLPWLWWAWVGIKDRLRVRDCLGIAVFSYLVVSGGWPSTWLAFVALLIGLAVESFTRRDVAAGIRRWFAPLALRAVASLAGLAAGGIGLVPLFHARAFTIRGTGVTNNNFLTGNLADMLSFAAPQLRGDVLTFGGGTSYPVPVYFAAWFAVVVFWCIRWDRTLWRRPGLVTAAVGCGLMLLLTQASSHLGPLRDQIRQVGGAQLFFAVAVCSLACAGRWVVTRARVGGIALTLAAMGWVSWSRTPDGAHGLVGILAVAVAAAVLVVVFRSTMLTALVAIATTFGLTLVAYGLYHAEIGPDQAQAPTQLTPGRLGLTAADEPIFAIYPSGSIPEWHVWQADGVGRAFANLREEGRIAPGYSSVSQKFFRVHLCIRAAQGWGCPTEAAKLFAKEPTTNLPWADLLGYRTVVVDTPVRQREFERVAGPEWHAGKKGAAFQEYRRSGPISVAGRITHVIGDADVSAISVSRQTQTYHVSTTHGARLIFRDIYWPGYVATLNGHRIPVRTLDRTLLSIDLPAGAHGVLRVSYVPLSTKVLVALPAAAVVLLGGACLGTFLLRRREGSGSAADNDSDDPTASEPESHPDADADADADEPARDQL